MTPILSRTQEPPRPPHLQMNHGPWCIPSGFAGSPALLHRLRVSWRSLTPTLPPHSPPQPVLRSIPTGTFWVGILLLSEESYERRHHGGGVAQSLDGRVGALLEVVVVPGHVEGGEGGATPLHGAGEGRGGQRHPQAAIWRQRALDRVRNGCCYGRCAGAQSSQGLWVLKSRETGRRGHPGAERQVVGCGKG